MELLNPRMSRSYPYVPVGGANSPPTNSAATMPISGLGGLPATGYAASDSAPAQSPVPTPSTALMTQPSAPTDSSMPAASSPAPTSMQGTSPTANPQAAAQHAQSFGRGDDSVLIHMTPNEVNSLRGLAQRFGGDLTTNPSTGLPEAGWLGRLLPTLLGGLLNFALPGVGSAIGSALGGIGSAAGTGLLVGAGTGIVTGDIGKGLMAGLQAFGGASLGGALKGGVSNVAGQTANTAATGHAGQAVGQVAGQAAGQTAGQVAGQAVGQGAAHIGQQAAQGLASPGLLSRFGAAAQQGLPGGIIGKVAPIMAAQGLLGGVAGAMTPSGVKDPQSGTIDNSYQGPYKYEARPATFAPSTQDILSSSKERDYFANDQPGVLNMQGQMVQPGSGTAPGTPIVQKVNNPKPKKGDPMYSFTTVPYMQDPNAPQDVMMQYAKGGVVNMDEGGFVIPARAVAEAGNGFTDAGFERFAKLGGMPIRGKGDGVSDDIPARIGDQEARVAAGEVYMPPQAVRRAGGAKKLYSLINQAHKQRKRGENSPIAKGLGAL